jgi:LEA14-like dessication related protein
LDREVKRVPVRTKVWEVKEFHVGKIPRRERTKIGLSDLAFTN